MKKFLIFLLIMLVPIMVFADENDEITNQTDNNVTVEENTVKSPDTGVEDYFLTLGVVCTSLGVVLYILNKKNVFAEI